MGGGCASGSCGGGASGGYGYSYGGGYPGGIAGLGGFGVGLGAYPYAGTGFGGSGTGPGCCIKSLDEGQVCIITDKINQLIECGKLAGVAACILVDGKPCFRGVFGQGSSCPDDKLSDNARFSYGSLSELFLSVAVLELMSRGNLRLEDYVSQYIPTNQPALADTTISELGGRYMNNNFYRYVQWASLVGCMSIGHLINKTDQKALCDIDEGCRVKPHVAAHSEYPMAVLQKVVQAAFPMIYVDPMADMSEMPPALSQNDFLDVLRCRYGFTSLGNSTCDFQSDPNAVKPLVRESCGRGDCDPCAPCNSCCSKKNICQNWAARYLMCHNNAYAWNLHGTIDDACRAMQILLQGGLPEDDGDCPNKCFPDADTPYFCPAALTQMFSARHQWEARDCNGSPGRAATGMIWYGTPVGGHYVWTLDALNEDGTSHFALLDREKCLGIVLLGNTLTPTINALGAYIYTLIVTCDCNLAQMEFERVWNKYYTYINNFRCCQPARVSTNALVNGGAVNLPTGAYWYGNLKVVIRCFDGNGDNYGSYRHNNNLYIQIGNCAPAKICIIGPGTFVASVTYSDGRTRLVQIGGGGGANQDQFRIHIMAECIQHEFRLRNYTPLNSGEGMTCCRGYIDNVLSQMESRCGAGCGAASPPKTVCNPDPPRLPKYYYGGWQSCNENKEFAFCGSCSGRPPVPTDCEPCAGGPIDDQFLPGLGVPIDPHGIYGTTNDACPPSIGILPPGILGGGYGSAGCGSCGSGTGNYYGA